MVIRKHIGYGHIAHEHAAALNRFYQQHLRPDVNLHRPGAQAEVKLDRKGRRQRQYRRWQTPWETLITLARSRTMPTARYNARGLQQRALQVSDTKGARQRQIAKQKLFAGFRRSA